MKAKIFCVLFFFFLVVGVSLITWGNTITKEYCQKLIDSAINEHSKKNYAKSIEIFIKTKDFAEANAWVEIEINTLNGLGVVYYSVPDYKKAMDYYMEAYRLVLHEPKMKAKEALLLNNIAGLYVIDKKYDMASDYYQKALLISQHIKDTISMTSLLNNLGAIANELNNMDLAIQYANSSLKISQDKSFMVHAQQIKAQALYQKQEYSAAEKLALKTFQQIQVYEIDYQPTISLVLLITKIYQAQGKEAEALLFIQKALDYSPNLQDIIDVYEQMAILYQKNQLPDLALAYKDSVIILKDSLNKINAFKDTENSHIRLELLNSERELSENKAKQKAERMLFMVVVIAIFILAVILIWVLRIQSIRNKQRKHITELELQQEKNQNLLQQEQLNNKNLRLEQQLKEQETSALLEQQKLVNEIEIKNRQLTAKILSQSHRNEMLEDIINKFSGYGQLENPVIKSIIQQLKMQLKDSSRENGFLSHFEQINPAFLLALKEKHPDLTDGETRLLSYIYLHLDIAEISQLLNITPVYTRKKRERLAKKMGVSTSELFDYIHAI